MNFADIEKQFIREKIYPEFDWKRFDKPSPLTPLRKPLSESRLAVVTTSGAHLKIDRPFNLRSPVGDPSYREIPNEANMEDIVLSHIGYNTRHVSADKNCVFPLDRLRELQAEGVIGWLNPRHFSFMGYVAETAELIQTSAPTVAEKLREDGADLILLAPA